MIYVSINMIQYLGKLKPVTHLCLFTQLNTLTTVAFWYLAVVSMQITKVD